MNELKINMLSESDLKELLDIRTQITRLQQRYDQIMSGSSPHIPSATPAPVQPAQPSPVQPQAPKPMPAPVAAAPVAPTPIPSRPAVAPSPVTAARPTIARAQTPHPSPVTARPLTSSTAPRPAQAAVTPKPEEAEPIKVDSSITSNLRQALVQILTAAGKPLSFNSIYSKLQEAGVQLPESKPMLVVRKLLYDKALFDVVKGGLFQIKAEVDALNPVTEEPSPASIEPAAPAQTAPAPGAMTQQPVSTPDQTVAAPQPPRQASSFSARLDAILNQ